MQIWRASHLLNHAARRAIRTFAPASSKLATPGRSVARSLEPASFIAESLSTICAAPRSRLPPPSVVGRPDYIGTDILTLCLTRRKSSGSAPRSTTFATSRRMLATMPAFNSNRCNNSVWNQTIGSPCQPSARAVGKSGSGPPTEPFGCST